MFSRRVPGFFDLVLPADICSRFGTQRQRGAIMFRKSRHRMDQSTADAWLIAALQSLAVLNLNIWLRWFLS
jgi:hypothetical protein